MISLTDQTVLITGASRGIGAAAAKCLAAAGARIALNYHRSQATAEALLATLPGGAQRHVLLPADVSQPRAVEEMFAQLQSRWARLDVLVANAGVWEGWPIEDMTPDQWSRVLTINLQSVFLCCHQAVQMMKRQGAGNLITISSTAGQRGEAYYSAYAASKGAIISFTKSLAAELGPAGIRVNCVAPGWVDTDMIRSVVGEGDEGRRRIEAGIPLQRMATADDIAGPILFLASALARHVHGEVLNVNGGSVLCG